MKYIALLSCVFLLNSCVREYEYHSDFLVRVEGLLSGNPRDGILVQLFTSQYDADHLESPLSPAVYTDSYGEVFFRGLEPGYRYFVRIDGVIFTKVRETRRLNPGANDMVLKLL